VNWASQQDFSHFFESFKPHFLARFVIDRNMVHHSSMNNPMSIDSHSSPLSRTLVKVSAEESHHVKLCAQTSNAIDNSDLPYTPQFFLSISVPTNTSNLSEIWNHMSSNSLLIFDQQFTFDAVVNEGASQVNIHMLKYHYHLLLLHIWTWNFLPFRRN
jgi:hypothetical protein